MWRKGRGGVKEGRCRGWGGEKNEELKEVRKKIFMLH